MAVLSAIGLLATLSAIGLTGCFECNRVKWLFWVQ